MKEVFRIDDVQKLLPVGKTAARLLMYFLKINTLNNIYDRLYPASGIGLIEKAFDYLEVKVDLLQKERVKIPAQDPFITVANHPFGFLDGLIALLILGKKRPDLKLTANYLLAQMEPFKGFFITVNPFDSSKGGGMGGTQLSLKHLQNGGALALFPAGEVSTWYKGQQGIMDKPWNLRAMRIILKARVPVFPILFKGHNSLSFHLLGKLHPLLRTARLPAEFLKKRNSTIRVTLGDRINPIEIERIGEAEKLAHFLRNRVYSLDKA